MKLVVLLLSGLFTFSASARILKLNSAYYIEASPGELVEMTGINKLLASKKASNIKLYADGAANILSMSMNNKEKLYSVSHEGFYFEITPFSGYKVKSADKNGLIEFNEVPGKKYYITKDGYFIF